MSKSLVRLVALVGGGAGGMGAFFPNRLNSTRSIHSLAQSLLNLPSPSHASDFGKKNSSFPPSQDFSLENASGWKEGGKECVLRDPSLSKRKALTRALPYAISGEQLIRQWVAIIFHNFLFSDRLHLLIYGTCYACSTPPAPNTTKSLIVLMRDVASASNNLHQSETDGVGHTTG